MDEGKIRKAIRTEFDPARPWEVENSVIAALRAYHEAEVEPWRKRSIIWSDHMHPHYHPVQGHGQTGAPIDLPREEGECDHWCHRRGSERGMKEWHFCPMCGNAL